MNKRDQQIIKWAWILTIGSAVLMVLNLAGWALGIVTHEQMDVITNVLSWLAMVATFGGALLTSYTKRDVNS